jgi:acyl carrier protein phosphodiesterase
MDMESCGQLQSALENVFQRIIELNELLSKPMPIVRADVLHEMARDASNIARLLDIVRGSGQRFPDIAAQLDAFYSTVTAAQRSVTASTAALGHDNAPYDACAHVLDDVKQIILHLVKMLEVADHTFVRGIHERVQRSQDLLARIRACDSESQLARLRADCQSAHQTVQRAVDNRLPLIEDPTPNGRLRNACAAVLAAEPALLAKPNNHAACDDMARRYAELTAAAAYRPPIIFEIDSDHNRAMMELAKRPYADRLRECEDKLAKHYKELDGLLKSRAPPTEVARVTKGIVAETKCEAGIARELAADPAYQDRAGGFNQAANALDGHSPTFAAAAKGFCKGDTDTGTRHEVKQLQTASSSLMKLFQGDDNASLLGAIDNVAQAIALLVSGVKELGVE